MSGPRIILRKPSMKNYINLSTSPFWILHFLCLGMFFIPFKVEYAVLAIALYYFRMFFITAGYHRYFSHRAYTLNRPLQLILAFLAMTSSQKGILWWASHHRDHHQHSDQEADIHSPKKGFFWSHMGWMLSNRYGTTRLNRIKDFAKFPELVWLDRYWVVPVITFALTLTAIGGLSYFLWGFCVSTVFLWHGTFTINSLSHVWGSRRYHTNDTSRNNAVLSVITLGEGWHNNHHQFPSAARNGFFWYEFDPTFYILKGLSWLRIVSNLRPVPKQKNLISTEMPLRARQFAARASQ